MELEHQQEQLKQEVLVVEQMEKIMVHLQVQQVILRQLVHRKVIQEEMELLQVLLMEEEEVEEQEDQDQMQIQVQEEQEDQDHQIQFQDVQ